MATMLRDPPLPVPKPDGDLQIFGKEKGIQGLNSSSYLDSTLMGMFAFNKSFDYLLKNKDDDQSNIRPILKDAIDSLRRTGFTGADKITALREILCELGRDHDFTDEERDPEEFLNLLLHRMTSQHPLLKLNTGQTSSMYQIFVRKRPDLELPTVQQLLEESMKNTKVKLATIPDNLLLIMPRHGKDFKVYDRIFPSLQLDLGEVIGTDRICGSCQVEKAEFSCSECFNECAGVPFERCNKCNEKLHKHPKRNRHKAAAINAGLKTHRMELHAIICIETSHYVSFIKCGTGLEAQWCFFDSMADRNEEKECNIPEVVLLEDDDQLLHNWLSEEGHAQLSQTDAQQPPQPIRRLLKDVYMCMYRSIKGK